MLRFFSTVFLTLTGRERERTQLFYSQSHSGIYTILNSLLSIPMWYFSEYISLFYIAFNGTNTLARIWFRHTLRSFLFISLSLFLLLAQYFCDAHSAPISLSVWILRIECEKRQMCIYCVCRIYTVIPVQFTFYLCFSLFLHHSLSRLTNINKPCTYGKS